MSNPAHVERVQRVMKSAWAALGEKLRRSERPNALTSSADLALMRELVQLWSREFPENPPEPLDVSGADLSGGLFASSKSERGSLFDGARFRGCNLQGSHWYPVHMLHADFTGANLHECELGGCFANGAIFRGADLSGAHIELNAFVDRDPVDFSDANLKGARFVLYRPVPFQFRGARMQGCRIAVNQFVMADKQRQTKEAIDSFLSCLDQDQRSQVVIERAATDSKSCLIATAACGSMEAYDVVQLRAFRDVVLRRSQVGRVFISVYERFSPPLARWVARSPMARFAVRALIVRPARLLADRCLKSLLDQTESTP